MRFCILVLALAVAGTGRGCKDDSFAIDRGSIIQVSSQESALPHAQVRFTVLFEGGTNGCAQPDRLDVTEINGTYRVTPWYRYPTDQEVICAMVMPVHELEFTLKAPPEGGLTIVDDAGTVLLTVPVVPPRVE